MPPTPSDPPIEAIPPSGLGGFKWLNLAQFGGALNDNFLKLTIIYALGIWWVELDGKEILGLIGAVFAIPFLLFLGLGGNLADRLSKSGIAKWAKFMEIAVGLCALAALYWQSVWGLLAASFLMSTQSALFGPVKYGIIPELVGKSGIAKANGFIQATTYIAIIVGTLLAPSISEASGQNFVLMGAATCVFALLGWLFSLGLPTTPRGTKTSTASPLIVPDLIRAIQYIRRDGFLSLAVGSSAYFSFVAGFAQLNLLSYGGEHLLLESQESSTWLFLFIALGIGAGSMLAGKVSRHSIEFGVVPIGVFLLSACSLGLGLIPPGSFWPASILCGLLGIGAGLFIVPVESFIQYRTTPSRRGEIIAATAWLSWVGILIASSLVFFLPKLGLTAAGGFILVGALVAVLFAFAMYLLPDFLVRFFVMILTRCYYRLRVDGQNNVPAQGAALLTANHAALTDAALLLSAQPRRIRFLMEREYLEESNALMRFLFRLMKVIPISRKGSPKDTLKALHAARQALLDEWLVGIFPEGTLTRTGHMLQLKRGYQKIVKDTDAPIIPVYIDGMYGAKSSYASPPPVPLSRTDFRHPIVLIFGSPLKSDISPDELGDRIRELAVPASILRNKMEGSLALRLVRVSKKNWSRPAVSDSLGRTATYGQLLISQLVISTKLKKLLDPAENIVGVMLPPSVAGVIANTSLTMLRVASANLNYTSSMEALFSAIKTAEMRTVITSRAFMEKLGISLPVDRCIYMEDILASLSLWEKLTAALTARLLPACMLTHPAGWHPDELLTVLFSSGSTALPKGVMLSHRNVASNIGAFSSVARTRPEDCVLGVLPFFHSMGYTTTLWFPLLKGISATYHHHPLECDQIDALCSSRGVTIVIGTPTFMLAWVRKIKPESLKKLRWACAGAEKMRPKLAEMFENRFGTRPMEGYGTTECSPVVSANVPDVDADGVLQKGCKEGTAGRPVPNIVCKIVDPENGQKLPPGAPGLLMVKGPSVMLGYLKNEDKTKEVLQDGWYNTGDIAVIDQDGFISITDRLSRFSKIAGEMVSHTAVEESIRSAAGSVLPKHSLGIAVTGAPDEKKGERLVVLFEEPLVSPEELHSAVLSSTMPNLWKPSRSSWIPVQSIPVLGTGKLDLSRVKNIAKEYLSNSQA